MTGNVRSTMQEEYNVRKKVWEPLLYRKQSGNIKSHNISHLIHHWVCPGGYTQFYYYVTCENVPWSLNAYCNII